jgi:hypothetical protein
MDESGRGERGDYTEIDAKSVYMGRISGQNRGGIFSDLFGGFGFSGGSLFNGMFGSVGNIVSEMFGDFFDIAPGPDNSGGFEGEEYRDFDEYEYDAFGDLVKKKEPATKIILDAERIDADDDGKLK